MEMALNWSMCRGSYLVLYLGYYYLVLVMKKQELATTDFSSFTRKLLIVFYEISNELYFDYDTILLPLFKEVHTAVSSEQAGEDIRKRNKKGLLKSGKDIPFMGL